MCQSTAQSTSHGQKGTHGTSRQGPASVQTMSSEGHLCKQAGSSIEQDAYLAWNGGWRGVIGSGKQGES